MDKDVSAGQTHKKIKVVECSAENMLNVLHLHTVCLDGYYRYEEQWLRDTDCFALCYEYVYVCIEGHQ